jgi:aryl-alcohol dehydrogenase-like predicted oxidoreductase
LILKNVVYQGYSVIVAVNAGITELRAMNYQELGRSLLKISEIGFGSMSLGNDHAENARLLQQAVEWGINFFDTADLYQKGFNEESVGRALARNRQQVIIATKVGNRWRPDGSGWDWDANKQYILRAVEQSLKRLQTDYIDLYQLHGGTIDDPIDDTIAAFEQLQQQGKIRYYGISSIRPNVVREYVKRSNIVSVMMQYSLLDRRPEESCLSLLQQNKIGVLARGPVAKGLLVSKPADEYLNYSAQQVEQVAAAVKKISGNERSAAQTAIRWVLNNPAISSAVVGIRTEEQLRDAVESIQAPALDNDELKLLQTVVEVNHYDQHR